LPALFQALAVPAAPLLALCDTAGEQQMTAQNGPRFLYGRRAILEFCNQHTSPPLTEKQMERMIRTGTVPTGRDGRRIIGEEATILAARRRLAGAT
jgi:hypothetical protein